MLFSWVKLRKPDKLSISLILNFTKKSVHQVHQLCENQAALPVFNVSPSASFQKCVIYKLNFMAF